MYKRRVLFSWGGCMAWQHRGLGGSLGMVSQPESSGVVLVAPGSHPTATTCSTPCGSDAAHTKSENCLGNNQGLQSPCKKNSEFFARKKASGTALTLKRCIRCAKREIVHAGFEPGSIIMGSEPDALPIHQKKLLCIWYEIFLWTCSVLDL